MGLINGYRPHYGYCLGLSIFLLLLLWAPSALASPQPAAITIPTTITTVQPPDGGTTSTTSPPMSTTTTTTEAPGQPEGFADVPADHEFYPAVVYLAERGIVAGYGNGLFGLYDLVKRAQIAKVATIAFGYHDEALSNPGTPTFSDVRYDGSPYPFDYVEEAAAAGLVLGYGDGRFGPWDNLTRVQLVRIIVRAAGNRLATPPEGYSSGFEDVPRGDEALVAQAKFNGLVEGVTASRFVPYGPAMRGHLAKVVYQALTAN